jgi:hypothetical protein
MWKMTISMRYILLLWCMVSYVQFIQGSSDGTEKWLSKHEGRYLLDWVPLLQERKVAERRYIGINNGA